MCVCVCVRACVRACVCIHSTVVVCLRMCAMCVKCHCHGKVHMSDDSSILYRTD